MSSAISAYLVCLDAPKQVSSGLILARTRYLRGQPTILIRVRS